VVCSKCAASLPPNAQFCLRCGQPVKSSASRVTTTTAETAALACSKCGAELPEGAQFCLECGKPTSVLPNSVPKKETAAELPIVEIIPPMPPRRKPKRRVFLWVVLAAIIAAVVWAVASDNPYAQGVQELVGWKHDQTILDAPFSVGAHTFRYYKFSLPEGSVNVAIVGQFTAANEANKNSRNVANDSPKDSNNDESGIEVFVLSEPAFTVWQNGYATSAVYESGRVSEGKVQAELPAGAGIYYLVFSNKFAPKTAKNINASVLLRYKSWLPESFRKMKERVSNWLAL
jgi:ribosomal protein L40E